MNQQYYDRLQLSSYRRQLEAVDEQSDSVTPLGDRPIFGKTAFSSHQAGSLTVSAPGGPQFVRRTAFANQGELDAHFKEVESLLRQLGR